MIRGDNLTRTASEGRIRRRRTKGKTKKLAENGEVWWILHKMIMWSTIK